MKIRTQSSVDSAGSRCGRTVLYGMGLRYSVVRFSPTTELVNS